MLTARNEEILDNYVGLSTGADELTKPFSARELVARVQVLLRRPRADRVVDGSPRLVGALRLDPAARRVWVNQVRADSTRTEFDVLDVLSARPRAAFTRRQLVDTLPWGEDWVGDEHLVDVHIGHLRRKPAAVADLPFVDTVRGVGVLDGRRGVKTHPGLGSLTTRGRSVPQIAVSVAMARR